MTLSVVDVIVDAALVTGRQNGLMPLSVAVLDAGGHLVAFKREDGSGLLRFGIAFGKAWGALGMGFGSRELFDRAAGNPTFMAALGMAGGGRLIPVPGAVLVRADAGTICAVGISGDGPDNDGVCAVAGTSTAGLDAAVGT